MNQKVRIHWNKTFIAETSNA